ncbi:MAG: acetyl-CoA carboxylase biotin carboxyl carrier protein [Xanthobacteraceae bacterium]|jgi:acetyl-CoA carboxylase biotin carboxyl carrier protein
MSLNYDEIAEILKIIDGSACDEVIVETGDLKLVVRRNVAGGAAAVPHDVASRPVMATPPATAPVTTLTPSPAAAPPLAQAAKAPHQIEVIAPMVGTFYRAPSPDAAVFVDIGSTVRKGDPLCLIEVMKLFTTIAAENDGRIVQIGAENAELVEYGRTLFVIEPI